MTQQQTMLVALERVRERREETTRHALEAATRAVQAALLALQQRQREQKAIEDDIAVTLQRPYCKGGAEMLQVQRGLRRVELLREHLVHAREKVQRAQTELENKQQARLQALQEHLRARHKREAVHDQVERGEVEQARLAERMAQDAVLDMAATQRGRSSGH
jgi:molybdopterin converting factor small subunit